MMKSSTVSSYDTTSGEVLRLEDGHFSKSRIVKNLLVLSIAWWMLFSGYDGLLMLQSTVNSHNGIGVISVSVQYACGCITAVLFPEYLIRRLGCKTVIVTCLISHAPYIAANFYPHWILMISSSILLGAANPLLWSAGCTYLNNLSTLYACHIQSSENLTTSKSGNPESKKECKCVSAHDCLRHKSSEERNETAFCPAVTGNVNTISSHLDNFEKNQTHNGVRSQTYTSNILEATTARFFGFHGMIYQTCHVTSNIVSYYILRIGIVGDAYVKNSTCNCGSDFCNDQITCFDNNLKPPSDTTRYILTTVCVVLVIFSVVIVCFSLDELSEKRKAQGKAKFESLKATCKLMKRWNLIFLIPMSIYIGVFQGLIMSDFTQAYVGCAWGIPNVGLVSAMLGFTLALSSTVSGWFVKYVGRPPIFLIVVALNIATYVIMLLWRPDGERPAMLFVVGGFLGYALGAFWSLLRAFYGILFKEDEEAAFGNYQLWHSVGVCISFGYSKYLCTSVKIYLAIFFFVLGFVGYLLAERSYTKSKQCSK